jgi:hypothetical protein
MLWLGWQKTQSEVETSSKENAKTSLMEEIRKRTEEERRNEDRRFGWRPCWGQEEGHKVEWLSTKVRQESWVRVGDQSILSWIKFLGLQSF